jgi:phosphohistidine swiveling domain-containing protein
MASAPSSPPSAKVCTWDSDLHPALNLWTTGNVEEVIPGVPTPFIATMWKQIDHDSAAEMVRRYRIQDLLPTAAPSQANWLGIFAGRGALGLAWFGAFLATFQTGDGSGALEMYFSSDKDNLQAGDTADRARAEKTRQRAMRSVWPQTVAGIDRANARISALRRAQQHSDLTALSDKDLWRQFVKLLALNSHRLASHVIISSTAGEMAAETGKLLAAQLGDRFEESMVVGLTTGLGDIESARPGFELWKIGRFVASRPALARQLRGMSAARALAALSNPPDEDWAAFARRFKAFVKEYGFRGQGEADPSVPTWDEDQTFVISVIKTNSTASDDNDPFLRARQGERTRTKLEARISRQLSPAARKEFIHLAAQAQLYARTRERSKACWVRANRLLRPVLLEMADRCARSRGIASSADFFYLTMPEVSAILAEKGERDYSSAVKSRRKEHARMETLVPPEVFEAPPTVAEISAPGPSGDLLTGNGVSTGIATGRARVIRSAAAAEETELEPGEVLVAPFTDAAWTPLFIPAAAVVVETGGMLSHAATVAREYGIPAVVAVRGATTLIKNGALLTVDGAAGTVQIGR